MFQPGNPGGPGRPAGSKDKSHLLAETWSARLDTIWGDLKSAQKANICCRIFCALVSRQQSHLTPEQSVANATAAQKLLEHLEKYFDQTPDHRRNSTGDAVRMADRSLEVQAPAPSNNGV
jgi:hypothetical protein